METELATRVRHALLELIERPMPAPADPRIAAGDVELHEAAAGLQTLLIAFRRAQAVPGALLRIGPHARIVEHGLLSAGVRWAADSAGDCHGSAYLDLGPHDDGQGPLALAAEPIGGWPELNAAPLTDLVGKMNELLGSCRWPIVVRNSPLPSPAWKVSGRQLRFKLTACPGRKGAVLMLEACIQSHQGP